METTLETLISRGAVDGRLLTLLQQSLPDRLDDVPDGFRLTARDVVVDGRSLRLTTPITRGEAQRRCRLGTAYAACARGVVGEAPPPAAHSPRLCRRRNHRQRNVAAGTRTQ